MNEDTHPISNRDEQLRVIGLLGGILLAIAVVRDARFSGRSQRARRRLGAVSVLMACWWVSEAIPLAATALVPVVLFPVLGVLPVSTTTGSYGHPLIFLFMGGLMLGKGLESGGAQEAGTAHHPCRGHEPEACGRECAALRCRAQRVREQHGDRR